MSFGGSASAMNSSIKSNNSLRRSRRVKNKFSKRTEFSDLNYQSLSEEENRRIVKENKQLLAQKIRNKRLVGVFVILFYGSIFLYILSLIIK